MIAKRAELARGAAAPRRPCEPPQWPQTTPSRCIMCQHQPPCPPAGAPDRQGGPRRGVSSRTGMEPAVQRRRGLRGHRRPRGALARRLRPSESMPPRHRRL